LATRLHKALENPFGCGSTRKDWFNAVSPPFQFIQITVKCGNAITPFFARQRGTEKTPTT
jgi:hypothetical protein